MIASDDPETSEVTIRIETISAYPEIDAPDQISFGNLDPEEDESETERIEVYNRGLEPLEISAVDVGADSDDPDDFSVEVIGTDELPASLDRHDFYYLDITFAPQGNGGIEDTRRAEVVVESDDPLVGEHVIEMSGNRPHPCLQTGGDIDFGEMSDGQSSTDSVALFNCSFTRDLEVTDIVIEDDADGVFELADDIDDPLEIIPQDVFEIEVEATMNTNQEVVGLLTLSSDDPEADHVEIELRAQPEDD